MTYIMTKTCFLESEIFLPRADYSAYWRQAPNKILMNILNSTAEDLWNFKIKWNIFTCIHWLLYYFLQQSDWHLHFVSAASFWILQQLFHHVSLCNIWLCLMWISRDSGQHTASREAAWKYSSRLDKMMCNTRRGPMCLYSRSRTSFQQTVLICFLSLCMLGNFACFFLTVDFFYYY